MANSNKYEVVFYDTSGTKILEYSSLSWEETLDEIETRKDFVDIYGRNCYFFVRNLSDKGKKMVLYLHEDTIKLTIYFGEDRVFKTPSGFKFV